MVAETLLQAVRSPKCVSVGLGERGCFVVLHLRVTQRKRFGDPRERDRVIVASHCMAWT